MKKHKSIYRSKTKKQDPKAAIHFLEWVTIACFFLLAWTLIQHLYLKKDHYRQDLARLSNVIIEGESAPRGRIYDRNHKLLVDNVSVPTIYYKKPEKITVEEEIDLAYQMADQITVPFEKLSPRNLKEFWLAGHYQEGEQKITKEEYEKLERRILSKTDIENLKISRITDEELSQFNDRDREAAYIYYRMNRGYSYEDKVIKEKEVTDEEFAYVSENVDQLKGMNTKLDWERVYPYKDTLRGILGSVSNGLPKEEKEKYLAKGYALNDRIGTSALEKQYEEYLRGTKAKYRKVSSKELVKISDPKRGRDLVLSIDIDLQQEVERIMTEQLIRAKGEANTRLFNKTYVVIQQPNTGEVLAISGKQIYRQNGTWKTLDITSGNFTDPMVPGSVIKGASMLVGYNTDAVKIGEVMSDECIKLKSIPAKCSSHQLGRLNDITALAESSNVYQFKIAMRVGGANYSYNADITIDPKAFQTYRNTFNEFGLGVLTGIDFPVESLGYIGKSTKPEHLLNFSMGQYDSYTPIQLSQYITTLASNGTRYVPHLLKEVYESDQKEELGTLYKKMNPKVLNQVTTEEKYLSRVQEGFKAVMTEGLGRNVMGTAPDPSGKTGTSETFLDTDGDGKIDTATVSNAFVGYAPRDNPVMSITVTSPDVEDPSGGYTFHSYVNRRIARFISSRYFEMYPV